MVEAREREAAISVRHDFNQKIVAGLRRREPSVDFLNAWEGEVIGLPDPEVLPSAFGTARILVSHERKTMPGCFAEFIEGRPSPGVLIVALDLDIGAAKEDLILLWATTMP